MKEANGHSGIYKIINLDNGREYIGGSRDYKQRWYYHLFLLRNNIHFNRYMQADFNQNQAFKLELIEAVNNGELKLKEQQHLDNHNNLYNISPSALNCKGIKRDEEFKEKIRIARIGKRHTETTKEKQRLYWTSENIETMLRNRNNRDSQKKNSQYRPVV